MRLAELSTRSGLPTPTIKYYLRLGLLAPGLTQSSTWASYGEDHVRRLALVKALTDVAGLSLDAVREVLGAVDDPGVSVHRSLGTAQWLLSPTPAVAPSDPSLARVDELLERLGWDLDPQGPLRGVLADHLDTLDRVGRPIDDTMLDAWAEALMPMVVREVASISADPAQAVEHAVVGTLLVEPVIMTLRRMAAEVASADRRPA